MIEIESEIEFLKMLLKVCHTTRDPRNRKSRPDMAIVSSRWEIKFQARLEELARANKPQPEPVAA